MILLILQIQVEKNIHYQKIADPFVPQTVGIMQTANIGMGVSIALDNSGYPTAAMAWNPDLNGYSIEPSGVPIIEPPKNGSGKCFWRTGIFCLSCIKRWW